MKKIKYISAIFIICLGLVLVGEIHAQRTLTAHQDLYPHTTFLFGEDFRDVIDDIKSTAKRNNIIAFAVETVFTTDMEHNHIIYSTQELPHDEIDKLGKGQTLKSLVLGSVHTSFESIDDAPSHTYGALFLYGSQSDINAFIAELTEFYPHNTPIEDPSHTPIYQNILIGYIVVALSYLLFLTLVEVFFYKKEVFIRVMQGASITGIVLRNMILDIAVYAAIFAVGSLVISHFTAVWHEPSLILVVFGVLVLINSLMYLMLYKLDFKSVTSNAKMPKRILKFSYFVKSAAALFAVVAITSAVLMISPTLKYVKAHDFFYAHREYSFGNFQYKINYNTGSVEDWYAQVELNVDMVNNIYKEYFDKCKPIVLYSSYDPAEQYELGNENQTFTHGIVYVNINAFDYIASVIDGFTMDDVTEDLCILTPNSMSLAEKETAVSNARMYSNLYTDYTHSVYYYDNSAEVVAISGALSVDDGFIFHENPVIVFDATHPTDERYRNVISLNGLIMYSFTDDILAEIIARYELDGEIAIVTNVYEEYNLSWFLVRAAIITASLISVLSLLLAIITIFRIVSLEYTVNATELCVKKILGWGAFRKNADIISGLFICTLLCSIIAVYAAVKLLSASLAVAIAVAGSIFLIDVLAVLWSVSRVEKARIVKILKGGAL